MSPFPGTPIQVDGRTSIPQDRHGWCPLSPTAAQTTQLLVEPPWMPAVLWDRVTLTCQGLGTSSDTTWYKDGQHWGQEGPENFVVTENGSYTCDRPGTGLSPPVRVSDGPLVLQAPAQAMLEGDTVTLRCRCRREMSVTAVRFCHGDKKVRMSLLGTELSLSPLQLHHSGPYHCRGWMNSWLPLWAQSVPVTVTVHGEHPTATTLTHPQPLPMDSGSQIPLPSPSQSSSRCRCWRVPLSPSRGPPSISAASAPPAPCGPQAPSCTSSTRTGSWWGSHRGPHSSWCLLWGSPTRGITAARCTPREGPCRRAVPGSVSWCTVSAGMGTGSPHSFLGAPGPTCISPSFP
uniref:Ig-like domain-containing protein n=1 Tax=Zosterops lateralis melanops TaxID=1220523 RepID=A0A8D2QSZ8_ZOSLA